MPRARGCRCSSPGFPPARALRGPPRGPPTRRDVEPPTNRRGRRLLPERRSRSKLLTSHFPLPAESDPEGNQDELDVEREALLSYVQSIIAELLPSRYVSRGENLSDSGESGDHPVAFGESWNLFEPNRAAVALELDFLDGERSRTDERHVSLEDVPELRKLVHRGLPQDPSHGGDPRVVLSRLDGPE